MQSPIKMPEVEMPKIDLTEFEFPKVDVGKALAEAATAAGLTKRPRSRWPFILGAGLIVVAGGLVAMNNAAIRERLSRAKAWIGEQVGAISDEVEAESFDLAGATNDRLDEPAAALVSAVTDTDPAEDFGASTGALATNGRSTAASRS